MTAELNIRDKLRQTLEASRDNPLPLFAGPETTGVVPPTPQGQALEQQRIGGDIQEIEGALVGAVGQDLDEGAQNDLLRLKDRLKQKRQGQTLLNQAQTDPKQFIADQVQGNFQEGEFSNPLVRADLSFSDTFGEKQSKFLSKYPTGDFVVVDRAPKVPGISAKDRGGKTILVRRNSDEPYIELDSTDFEIADIADLVGAAPELAAEGFGLFLTRGTGFIKQAMAAALGGAVGEAAEESVEALRGFQKETAKEMGKRIGFESSIAAAGPVIAAPISGPIRALDKGFVGKKEGAEKAIKFAEDAGLAPLRLDQVSTNKIAQMLGRQSEAQIDALGDYTTKQNKALVNTLLTLRDADAKRFVRGELKDIHEESIQQLKSALPEIKGDLFSAGDAVRKGLEEYDELSRAAVDTLYEKARKTGDVEFDLAPALSVADDLEAGVAFKTLSGGQTNVEPTHPSVQKAIDLLREIDFNAPVEEIGGRVYGPVERLRSVVQYLNDVKAFGTNPLSMEKDANARQAARQASKLFSSLKHVMDNPVSGDAAVIEAYKEASAQASKRFETMQDVLVKDVLSRPEGRKSFDIAGQLASPGRNVDDLKFIKDVLTRHDASGKQLAEFRNGVIGNMLDRSNLPNLKQTLAQYNEEQRKILFPEKVWQGLDNLSNEVERSKLLDIENVLNRQSKAAAAVGEIIDTKNTGAMKRLLEFMPKDPEDLRRKSLRAAVIDDILADSLKFDRQNPGLKVLDNDALQRKLDDLTKSGAIKILTSGDVKTLRNAQLYRSFIAQNSDVGTSLQAAETAAQFREIFSPAGGGLKSLITLAEAYGTARVLMNPAFQAMAVGKGSKKAKNAADMINATATMMATLNKDIAGYTESEKILTE